MDNSQSLGAGMEGGGKWTLCLRLDQHVQAYPSLLQFGLLALTLSTAAH